MTHWKCPYCLCKPRSYFFSLQLSFLIWLVRTDGWLTTTVAEVVPIHPFTRHLVLIC